MAPSRETKQNEPPEWLRRLVGKKSCIERKTPDAKTSQRPVSLKSISKSLRLIFESPSASSSVLS